MPRATSATMQAEASRSKAYDKMVRPTTATRYFQRTDAMWVFLLATIVVINRTHAWSTTVRGLPSSYASRLCLRSPSSLGAAAKIRPFNDVPTINSWRIMANARVVGVVSNHPDIPDGDVITTSPIGKPETVQPRRLITTISGSRYKLGNPELRRTKDGKVVSILELQRQARVEYDLNGEIVGDDTRQYLLVGKPTKSTSGKSLIYKAFRADSDGFPTGETLTVKISSNWEAIEREADNYAKITKSGFLRGQFIELIDFLPTASILTPKFKNMSALVMQRGTVDLKRYLAMKGPLEGKELRAATAAAAQCIQAVHSSGLVWTDMKTENFVVTESGSFKGIDLESAMPLKDNPVDYSPEGTPPEFARAFLAGDGPYFVLQFNYDIWSLGMLFYELAVGKGYFDGKTPVQITKALRDGPVIDVSAVTDKRLRNLVAKCVQLDPKKRPSILEVLLHPYFLSSGIGPISF